jgi:hypothetical protein
MSSVLEIVTDKTDALTYSPAEMKRRRPSGKKEYKPHIATKVKWALTDVGELAVQAQDIMTEMWVWFDEERRAAGRKNYKRKASLGEFEHMLVALSLKVSKLERISTQAITESKPAVEK